jgi:hypothetical protein
MVRFSSFLQRQHHRPAFRKRLDRLESKVDNLVTSEACDAIHVLPIRLEGARVEGDSLGEVRGIAVRISDDIRRAVVFFGVPTERSPIEYGGTGFLAAFKAGTPFPFTYLITARHVATALQQHEDTGFHIRANIKDGESVAVPILTLKKLVRNGL